MIFKIEDGREQFYQWDSNRRLVIGDESIQEVHFCNRTDDCSLVCEVYEEDGQRLANVPNVLLQTAWRIKVYAYDVDYTKHCETFDVIARTKPSDYIYTETEVKRYEDLEERLEAVEEGLEGKLDIPTKLADRNGYVVTLDYDKKVVGYKHYTSSPNANHIPVYDNNGKLYAKYTYWDDAAGENITVDSRLATVNEVWDWVSKMPEARSIYCYDNGGELTTDEDFIQVADGIWGNGEMPFLMIGENENNMVYEVITDAKVYMDDEYNFTHITFGDKYLWRVDGNGILEPIEKKEKVYELIDTITLTEEVKTVGRSNEPDGTPYKLEAVMLRITAPQATENQQGYCYMYGSDGGRVAGAYFSGMISSSGERTSTYIAYPLYGNWFSYSLGSVYDLGNTAQINNYPKMNGARTTTEYPYITGIQTYVITAFPVGTTIEVWGVRA